VIVKQKTFFPLDLQDLHAQQHAPQFARARVKSDLPIVNDAAAPGLVEQERTFLRVLPQSELATGFSQHLVARKTEEPQKRGIHVQAAPVVEMTDAHRHRTRLESLTKPALGPI